MKNHKKLEGMDVLLFLDVDGVLNTTDARHTKYTLHNCSIRALAGLMGEIEKEGGRPKLILTSTWRIGYAAEFEACSPQIQKLIRRLEEFGIHIDGRTPIYKNGTRDREILRFIWGYSLEGKDFLFITLDDDASIYDKGTAEQVNYYRVNRATGLTVGDIDRIMKRLFLFAGR